MESSSFIDGLLQESLASRVKGTEKADVSFGQALTATVEQYIRESVTSSATHETITSEGVGKLAPSARKTIVRRWLRHEPTNAQQLRTGETEISGQPAHTAERAVIHLVDAMNISDSTSLAKQQRRTAVIEWLGKLLTTKTFSEGSESAGELPIKIEDVQAMVHLVERNAFGQITKHEYPLHDTAAAHEMHEIYAASSTRVLQSDKEKPSTTRGIGFTVLGGEIAEAIIAATDPRTVIIPLYLSDALAKEYPGRYISLGAKEPKIIQKGTSQ